MPFLGDHSVQRISLSSVSSALISVSNSKPGFWASLSHLQANMQFHRFHWRRLRTLLSYFHVRCLNSNPYITFRRLSNVVDSNEFGLGHVCHFLKLETWIPDTRFPFPADYSVQWVLLNSASSTFITIANSKLGFWAPLSFFEAIIQVGRFHWIRFRTPLSNYQTRNMILSTLSSSVDSTEPGFERPYHIFKPETWILSIRNTT